RALQEPIAVPVQFSESWFLVHSPELMSLKAAAFVLDADAELRSRQGDASGALLTALDGMRLSEAVQRGGVLIDFLVGSACEGIGVHRMTNLLSSLRVEGCKQVIPALQAHEPRDPLEAIKKRKKEWSRRSFSILTRVGEAIRPKRAIESLIADVGK